MKLAVIGVGLIGGSFAAALKQAKMVSSVVGVGRSAANLELARKRGLIDSIAESAAAAARGADLVLIATPVAQFEKVFAEIAASLEPKAVVTDAGSTKQDVIAAARKMLKGRIAQFVPAHPIAGAEKSGAEAATAELFRNRRVVVTPVAEDAPSTIRKVTEAWAACGARVTTMQPDEHDVVLAAVSHLPHLLAFALVHEMAGRENSAQLFAYAAGGFRDFTRIASSHPEMWRDICLANRQGLLQEVLAFEAKLREMKKMLSDGSGPALEKLFAEAREARGRWLAGEFDD